MIVAVAVLALAALHAQSQAKTGTTEGDLRSNLCILNLFEEQPEIMRQLYSAAYGVLASDPQASFANVAHKPEV